MGWGTGKEPGLFVRTYLYAILKTVLMTTTQFLRYRRI